MTAPILRLLLPLAALGALAAPALAEAPDERTHGARSAGTLHRSSESAILTRSETAIVSLDAELRQRLQQIWAGRGLRRGTTAIYVVDARTGKPLYAVHEDARLNPASNVKLISTAAALDVLGPDWRYTTRVFGPAPDSDGVVRGDIYLLGNHDPTLRAHHLAAIGERMAKSGVRRIEGDVVVGDSLTRDAVGHHRVALVVRGGERHGQPATVELDPPNEFVEVRVEAQTARTRRAQLRYRAELAETPGQPVRYVVTVQGKLDVGHKQTHRRWVPRRNLFTAHVLRSALVGAGIEVTGDARELEFEPYVAELGSAGFLPVELGKHRSATAAKIAAVINKRSINYMADQLVNTAGAVLLGGEPTMDKGIEVMNRWLAHRAGIDPQTVTLDTGSGLSYKTELSAQQIVRVLRVASGYLDEAWVPDALEQLAGGDRPGQLLATTGPVETLALDVPRPRVTQPRLPLDMLQLSRGLLTKVFRSSLAVGGKDGTLLRRFRGSAVSGNLLGKTGTLTGIVALAGILQLPDDDEHALAFAIVTNGSTNGRRGSDRREHEKLVEVMYEYLQARRELTAATR